MKPFQLSVIYLKICTILMITGLIGIAGFGVSLLLDGLMNKLFFEKPGYTLLILYYLALVPFLYSLFHVIHILRFISLDIIPFIQIYQSMQSIKTSLFITTNIGILMFPVFFYIAQADDAPGLILISIALIVISLALDAIIICCQHVIKKINFIKE